LFNTAALRDFFRRLPKVDLHRHLEGSLRFETLMELARTQSITVPLNPNLRSLVQMTVDDPLNFTTFLSKFQTLRLFYLSPEIIQRVAYEAVADAAADNVRYLELRFTPVALSRARGFPMHEVMDWVCDSTARAARDYPIVVRLIASVNRHEAVSLAEEVVGYAAERISRGVVGIDLAGNEAEFSAAPFAGLFREARQAGLRLCAHAGEWNGPQNVREAIQILGADRIGHGVRVLEDEDVTALAAERNLPFEVCVTSNYQTGVVAMLTDHPLIRMLNASLNVTINTDDPSISGITLSDEYRIVCRDLGLPRQIMVERILAAAQASFLPDAQKARLVQGLSGELDKVNWLLP
jgi:adenosine deaminase